MANYRYVAPLKNPILIPRVQAAQQELQRQRQISNQDNEALKKLYGYDPKNYWDPMYTRAFGELKTEVARRIDNYEYTNSADLIRDINALDTQFNEIDRMYTSVQDSKNTYDSIMGDIPGNETDETEIIETPEALVQKDKFYNTMGAIQLVPDVNNLSIYYQGTDFEGNPYEGPISSHPNYASTDIYNAATQTRAYIQPSDVAEDYLTTSQRLYNEGKSKGKIRDNIREDLTKEYTSDPKKLAAITRWWQSEGNPVGTDSFEPVKNFVDQVIDYIPFEEDSSGAGGSGGGSGSGSSERTIEDVRYTSSGPISIGSENLSSYRITATTPNYDKDFAIDFNSILDLDIVTEELRDELGNLLDEGYPSTFIPTVFEVMYPENSDDPVMIQIESMVTASGRSIPLSQDLILESSTPEGKAFLQLMERRMKALYGDEFTLFKAKTRVTSGSTPIVDWGAAPR